MLLNRHGQWEETQYSPHSTSQLELVNNLPGCPQNDALFTEPSVTLRENAFADHTRPRLCVLSVYTKTSTYYVGTAVKTDVFFFFLLSVRPAWCIFKAERHRSRWEEMTCNHFAGYEPAGRDYKIEWRRLINGLVGARTHAANLREIAATWSPEWDNRN